MIWWSDPEGEFLEFIADLDLDQAEVIALADNPALAVKRRIELEGTARAVVLHESQSAPEPGDDWLLHIRLYAASFAADATSMLQQNLGLRSAGLRDHLKTRARFSASKDRTARLATLLRPDNREREIDAKIWAVLARGSSGLRGANSSHNFFTSAELPRASTVFVPRVVRVNYLGRSASIILAGEARRV